MMTDADATFEDETPAEDAAVSKTETKNPKDKLDKQSAIAEFERFADLMDLDIDLEDLDDEDRKGFESQKRIFVKAVQRGSLIVNETGEPVFTPQRSKHTDPITFREPDGAALMSMDRKKKSHNVSKTYGIMQSMTGVHQGIFAQLKTRDLDVCTAIVTLFLG